MATLQDIISNENLALSCNPRGTDKGDFKSYVNEFYQPYFSKRQNDAIKLLEIGYRHGASLALWSSFFTKGKIFGLDNGSDKLTQGNGPVDEWIDRPNVQALVADAYDSDFAKSLNEKFDIIIDDGPHSLESQRKAIRLYLDKLNTNGLFVVEDIQRVGGLCLFCFLPLIPLNFRVDLFDFRSNKKGNDDLLFVVTYTNNHDFVNRARLWAKAFAYLLKEPARFVFQKFSSLFTKTYC